MLPVCACLSQGPLCPSEQHAGTLMGMPADPLRSQTPTGMPARFCTSRASLVAQNCQLHHDVMMMAIFSPGRAAVRHASTTQRSHDISAWQACALPFLCHGS